MDHCDEYLELISAAIDGALSPAQQEKLNVHLASCPACKALYEDLSALHAGLAALPPVAVPADLTERIMAAVEAEKVLPFAPVKKRPQPWRKWAAAAAVLAIVLVGRTGFTGRSLLPQEKEPQAVSANSMDPAEAQDAIALQSEESAEETLPNAGTGAAHNAATVQATAGDSLFLPVSQGPAASVPPADETPAPAQGPMLRSASVPEGDTEEDASLPPQETAPAVRSKMALQPFMASLPLPSDLPEDQTPESGQAPDANTLLTAAATDMETKSTDFPEEAAHELPTPLTPREALELAAQCVLDRENVENLEREDPETEDAPLACAFHWNEGEIQHHVLLRYREQDQEPDVYYIVCTWDCVLEDGGYSTSAFLYLVDKTTGQVDAVCTD